MLDCEDSRRLRNPLERNSQQQAILRGPIPLISTCVCFNALPSRLWAISRRYLRQECTLCGNIFPSSCSATERILRVLHAGAGWTGGPCWFGRVVQGEGL